MSDDVEARIIAEVGRALDERRLTVNSASERFSVDRLTLSKFSRGKRPSLGWLERWAEKIGEDPGHWRQVVGYGAVSQPGDSFPYDAAIFEARGMRRLADHYGAEYTIVTRWTPPDPAMPEDEMRNRLARRERAIRAKKGLPPEGGIFT